MQLILGGAQFGSHYGVSNNALVSETKVEEILNTACQLGIHYVDTAADYGASETLIGRYAAQRYQVGTKISPMQSQEWNATERDRVLDQIYRSLDRLCLRKLSYLHFHSASDLHKPGVEELTFELHKLREQGLVERFGVSIYQPQDLNISETLLEFFDLVQAPLNPLDQRILSPNFCVKLQKYDIRIQARSVFLQGLLLMNYREARQKIPRAEQALKQWHHFLKQNNLDTLSACIYFLALQKQHLESAVIGAVSAENIREWHARWQQQQMIKPLNFSALACDDPHVIEPRKWKLS